MKIREYGKTVNKWYSMIEYPNGRTEERLTQKEIAYKDYDAETGEIVGCGTEDIQFNVFGGSQSNSKNRMAWLWVWTWDGEKMNKGNHRWFEDQGCFTYRPSGNVREDNKAIKALMKLRYPKAAEIQLRRA